MDLPAILAAQLDTTIASGKKAQDVLGAATDKAQSLMSGLQDIYAQVAKDQSTVTAATVAAKLNTQVATDQVVNAIGADPANPANIYVQLATRQKASIEATNKSFDELNRLAKIGPTEDLLGFLSAQFGGVSDARKAFRENLGRTELVSAQVAQINKTIIEANSSYKTAEAPITAASADAATRLAASEAQASAAKVALESVKYGTEAMLRAQQLSKEQLSLLFQAQSASIAQQQNELALKQFDFHKEEFDWRKQERQLLDEARLEGKTIDEHVINNINTGYAALGLPPVDPREAKVVLSQFKAGKADLQEAYERGRATTVTGIPMVGTSAAVSVDTLTAHPEAIIPPSRDPTVKLLATARDTVLANPKFAGEKDKKKVDKAINDTALELMKEQYGNVTNNPDNVFYVGDLKQYLGSPKGDPRQVPPPYAIGISPLYTKLLKPIADTGADMSDPKIVMRMVTKGVVDKTITFEEAVDIATVYRQAIMINLQAKGLTSFGLVPPDAGRTLNVRMGRFGNKIDISNPVDVSRFLSQELGAGGSKGMVVPEETYLRNRGQ
jgi:hypothetical protein